MDVLGAMRIQHCSKMHDDSIGLDHNFVFGDILLKISTSLYTILNLISILAPAQDICEISRLVTHEM